MLLAPAANHILGLEDGKKRYLDEVLALTKAYSLCGTLDEAQEYKEEIAFFQAVKSIIQKAGVVAGAKKNPNNAIKQIIDNAVIAQKRKIISSKRRNLAIDYNRHFLSTITEL